MVEIRMEPRVAAYVMTLMSLALNDERIGGNLAPTVQEALRHVKWEIGEGLEPYRVPVQEVMEEMLPLAEFGEVRGRDGVVH